VGVNNYSTGTISYTIKATWTTITQPNLTPYKPVGWSDKIVVSKTTGTNTDSSPLYSTDTLYVDWAVINNGTGATAARFYTKLYVDGGERQSWYTDPPLNANYYAYATDYSIGTLSAGTHTIKIVADSTGAIVESNEGDNDYTKTITVLALAETIIYVSQDGVCGNKGPCFATIQNGINSAVAPTAIRITQETYNENVILNSPKELTIQGGWDSTFTTDLSNTVIKGSLTISDGTLIVENVILE